MKSDIAAFHFLSILFQTGLGAVITIRAGRSRDRVLVAGRQNKFISFPNRTAGLWRLPILGFPWVLEDLRLVIKQPRREVDYSFPPSSEVKNELYLPLRRA